MSMIAEFRHVPAGLLEAVRRDESLVRAALAGEPSAAAVPERYEDMPLPANIRALLAAMPEPQRAEFLGQLNQQWAARRASIQGTPLEAMIAGSTDAAREGWRTLRALGFAPQQLPEALSLDKAWHGVHFLLTGSADDTEGPTGSAVLGGREFQEDLGYGPCRYLEPSEVSAVAGALEEAGPEVAKRYDAARMTQLEIYPGGWDREQSQWLNQALERLARYYSEAARLGHAMLLVLQ